MDSGSVTLGYIFRTFLKIGATSFGGFMALVAMVQRQVVEKDKKLSAEDLLDSVSLASILPGPVAFNVIVYIGYKMRGFMGAIVAFTAILLPSFLLVVLFSYLYFLYGHVPAVKSVFEGILPTITGLIVAVGYEMARKSITKIPQVVVMVVSFLLLFSIRGYAVTLGVMIGSAVFGGFYFRPKNESEPISSEQRPHLKQGIIPGLLLLLIVLFFFFGMRFITNTSIQTQIVSVFSGMSLTLFGGGYVVIPTLHEMFVANLHWLTSAEFADGIAIGQITPGPIFISAAFIGYKVWNIPGALLATLSFFIPPAVLMLVCSRFMDWFKHSGQVKAVFKGIRPAVIGMIFASVPVLGQSLNVNLWTVGLLTGTIFLTIKYKISPIYLICLAGAIGIIFL